MATVTQNSPVVRVLYRTVRGDQAGVNFWHYIDFAVSTSGTLPVPPDLEKSIEAFCAVLRKHPDVDGTTVSWQMMSLI